MNIAEDRLGSTLLYINLFYLGLLLGLDRVFDLRIAPFLYIKLSKCIWCLRILHVHNVNSVFVVNMLNKGISARQRYTPLSERWGECGDWQITSLPKASFSSEVLQYLAKHCVEEV